MQVHFSTDNRAAGSRPRSRCGHSRAGRALKATVFQSLLYRAIIYPFVVEMTEMLGYDMLYGPCPHFRASRARSASESVRNYWLQMNLWDPSTWHHRLTATSMWYDSR